jgi:acyl transferase domain-containing protein
MLAVGLGPEEVQPFIKGQSGVVIGCYNSPQSVTLSGQAHVIEEIRVSLAQAGIFARKVNTSDNAYHSHLMASAAQKFQGLFSGIYSEMIHSPARNKRLPRIPMYSCITGELLKAEIVPFEYWRSSLELPVLFDQASQALFASHSTARYVVEIGPHSALAGPIRQITMSLGFSEERLTYLPTLVRGEDGVDNVLRLVGTLFNLGYPVDLTRVNAMDTYYGDVSDEEKCEIGKLLVDLPTYQWNYEGLLWKESRRGREFRFRKHCRHDLLGSREPGGSQNSHLWRNHLDVSFVPWLQDHKVTITPTTFFRQRRLCGC